MFDSAAFCASCGARRERADGVDAGTRCPGCGAGLVRVSVGGAPLLECRQCDGVWLEAADFERICTDQEAQAAVLHHITPRAPADARAPVKYRPCVRCGKMMNRVNFGQVSGTVVDVCRGHGTYLDAGELHQIVTFINDGGLDRARTRHVEELREEQRRLRELERKAALDRHASSSSPWTVSAKWGDSGIADLIDLITRNSS
jgi:Zn-finger nucleic acid-binding protein